MHRALATPSHPRLWDTIEVGESMQTTCIHHTAVTACVSVVNLQELEAQLTCSDAYIHVGGVYDFGQRPATINSMETPFIPLC